LLVIAVDGASEGEDFRRLAGRGNDASAVEDVEGAPGLGLDWEGRDDTADADCKLDDDSIDCCILLYWDDCTGALTPVMEVLSWPV